MSEKDVWEEIQQLKLRIQQLEQRDHSALRAALARLRLPGDVLRPLEVVVNEAISLNNDTLCTSLTELCTGLQDMRRGRETLTRESLAARFRRDDDTLSSSSRR